MDLNEFRQMKASGELVTDAALQQAENEITPDDRYEEPEQDPEIVEEQEHEENEDAPADDLEDAEDQEDIDLPPREKTAFEKRMEREKAKLEEKLRKELEEQLEGKYSKHKQAIEALGGDPDQLIKAAQEAKMMREAQRLADQNGWDDEQTQWYIEQQKQQQELKELRVQMQINRLKDNPDYAGIASMEREILAKIDKTNGALTVEEAYWALGGHKRAEQIKLEVQQREIARRAQQPRTVQRDAPSTAVGEKPLPPEVLRDAKLMGISESEARRLYNSQAATDLDSWREQRKKAK
ncbi:hypothetical protein PN4B1_16970 [Paenibacillus naphthalenovorans]|uniref:hypothetical protein n=1 Tax=Paenibacillus naphthalenovorans TaxID=162209 RepID=UPI0010B273B8|nr:hypothetical protein [Paenibacillus naphthalenovorans]GCL71792.1 hypothetical protein PN4B1_16970 [Paenibacillus naphthalenovorans]